MALIPKAPELSPTAAAIYAVYEAREAKEEARPYLGGSEIGNPCERALWYSFRWATRKQFIGRMLRLFQRGHREEPWLVDDMRAAGITVWPLNPATKQQWGWTEPSVGHHYAGHGDGVLKGVPEAPKAPHIWECKTHATKSFIDVKAKGVEKSKPKHFFQMQQYMHWSIADFGKTNGCQRALYTAVCKETDEIFTERVRYDETIALGLIAKAKRVIFAATPLAKMNEDPTWYECKFCDEHPVCHGMAVPRATCRSCIHSTPEIDGKARWTCNLAAAGKVTDGSSKIDIPVEIQRIGCENHRFIPDLLKNWATPIDGSAENNWVRYRVIETGAEFCNSFAPEGITSAEIHAAKDKRALTDKGVQEFRDVFEARIGG
jgi:hypothetical protein